jgi:murein DD-endopeptidase MepM/ murein hydrolase activator NlpD
MITIASAEEVTISIPEKGYFSFFNSPYPAHRLSSGVDIYPGGDFGEAAVSPVNGEVSLIRKVRAPKGRTFKDHGHDTVVLLTSDNNPERVIKVLHIEPTVSVGDRIKQGDALGTIIRSGYFGYSTRPHIHLEIRRKSDPLRARGGYVLNRLLDIDNDQQLENIEGVVVRSLPEYTVLRLDNEIRNGLPCTVGGEPGIIDGGIPYYGWLGVHTINEAPDRGIVRLCDEPIATVNGAQGRSCTALFSEFSIRVNGRRVGLSLYLYPYTMQDILLIPLRPGKLSLEESSEIKVSIN